VTLDPVYCADGCGRLAETERPAAVSGPGEVYGHTEDGWIHTELVCRRCALEETG
jgi:hypothetical protein